MCRGSVLGSWAAKPKVFFGLASTVFRDELGDRLEAKLVVLEDTIEKLQRQGS
jgi:hypothetical protein